jgi:hypothetical protein
MIQAMRKQEVRRLLKNGSTRQKVSKSEKLGWFTYKDSGHNVVIPDSVFRRLELDSLRRGVGLSRLVTDLLVRGLSRDLKVVVSGEQEGKEQLAGTA